ncbi:MAG: penicillin-binding protein activator LpoB, partial [Moritella sp.]|nr:penicillin-binding protein activator LpoB [Moritella sp.]
MNKLCKLVLGSILVSTLLTGCSTTVERIDAGQTVDLSGAWNDTDSQMVAQEM